MKNIILFGTLLTIQTSVASQNHDMKDYHCKYNEIKHSQVEEICEKNSYIHFDVKLVLKNKQIITLTPTQVENDDSGRIYTVTLSPPLNGISKSTYTHSTGSDYGGEYYVNLYGGANLGPEYSFYNQTWGDPF